MEHIRITHKLIEWGGKGRVGFTHSQARVLGIPWPLRSGWKSSLVGGEISLEDYRRFLAAGNGEKRLPPWLSGAPKKRIVRTDWPRVPREPKVRPPKILSTAFEPVAWQPKRPSGAKLAISKRYVDGWTSRP